MIGIYAPFGKMGKALLAYLDEKQMPFTQYDRVNLQTFLDDASVIIDFSTHQATEDLLKILLISSNPLKKLVIGTTGLDEETFLLIEEYSKIAPVFYAQNFSQGITVLKKLIQIAAKALDYDIEIFEAHHALKKDAPSGTALYLGGGVASSRGQNLNDVKTCYQSSSESQVRKKGQIGFSVARGGHAIGEHSVFFFGDNEEIKLTHRGYSRTLYAEGAVLAANWLINQKPGLYSMDDLYSE
ncbi:MAG: 4-hydroxy-tetrahydrodipicolinate reductase [Proteobacteria bacterium]|nr:4-hydroxy-tetrahydrodipicolinate reductase [Pseudomonadota bacterium]